MGIRFLEGMDVESDEYGRWIVDELIWDPHYPGAFVVLDKGQYYKVTVTLSGNNPMWRMPHYTPSPAYDKPKNYEYVTCGLVPRKGFEPIKLGRAMTETEFAEFCKEENLGEDDISDIFDDTYGQLYGKKIEITVKVRQIKAPRNELTIEAELRNRGIQAAAMSPGRVNIRVG